jgi:hypothetical protein
MPTGVLRKPKAGISDLGGLTKVFVFETSQFTDDVNFPTRDNIVEGTLTSIGLKHGQSNLAARIIFDVKEAEARSEGRATSSQFSFLHSLIGKVAGYTKEKYSSIDTYMGKDLMIIIQRPNGDRLLLGQTFKPMRMTISDTLGKGAEEYVGSDISFFQTDAVDFRPPFWNLAFNINGPIPAYEQIGYINQTINFPIVDPFDPVYLLANFNSEDTFLVGSFVKIEHFPFVGEITTFGVRYATVNGFEIEPSGERNIELILSDGSGILSGQRFIVTSIPALPEFTI